MSRPSILPSILFVALLACGEDTPDPDAPPAEDAPAEPAPAEDGAPPAEPTQVFDPNAKTGEVGPDCNTKLTGKTCGHPDGPLRREKSMFFGLTPSRKDMRFRDGRSLTAYARRPGSVQAYKVGDATFDDAEFYFDRHRLRLHRVFRMGMSPAECALAPPKITEEFGKPLVDKRGEKMWRLDWIEVRWRDTAIDGSNPTASRCQVEYRDRDWFLSR
jgi:hypothetical protein